MFVRAKIARFQLLLEPVVDTSSRVCALPLYFLKLKARFLGNKTLVRFVRCFTAVRSRLIDLDCAHYATSATALQLRMPCCGI